MRRAHSTRRRLRKSESRRRTHWRLGSPRTAYVIATEHAMLIRQLGLTLGTKQSGGTTSLVAGLSLPFPILDQNRGEIARATAERDAAQFELAAQERTVRAEVSGAYYAARILTDRANALDQRSNGYLARAD